MSMIGDAFIVKNSLILYLYIQVGYHVQIF